jgi:CubicO group peptidase (beta-lactamase class C family)
MPDALHRDVLSRRALLRGSAVLGAGAALGGWPALAASAPAASVSPDIADQWPKVTGLLDRYVRERKVPGMLAAFGWGDGPLGVIGRGSEGFDDADPVGADSLFRVYSMTKPITGMAAMMLIDEGKLGLDQKLADFVPEFARPMVAIDPAKGLEARAAQTAITIRHLLTHTSGMGYAGLAHNRVSAELLRLGVTPAVISRMQIPGLSAPVPTPGPDEFLRLAASVPLVAEPGTKWRYSMGLDVLGLVIARASGAKSLGAFLDERLFGPAGMRRSFFQVPSAAEARLTTNYGVLAGVPVPIDKPRTTIFRDRPAFAFGGAGLVTSPADYDRFLRMLLGGGVLGRRRVMSARAVVMGMSNLLPAGADTTGTMVHGNGFGAGGLVGLGADEGTFGWSGAAGTVGLVSTRIGLRAGLYVQFMPPETYPIQREFREAARDDVAGRPRR